MSFYAIIYLNYFLQLSHVCMSFWTHAPPLCLTMEKSWMTLSRSNIYNLVWRFWWFLKGHFDLLECPRDHQPKLWRINPLRFHVKDFAVGVKLTFVPFLLIFYCSGPFTLICVNMSPLLPIYVRKISLGRLLCHVDFKLSDN